MILGTAQRHLLRCLAAADRPLTLGEVADRLAAAGTPVSSRSLRLAAQALGDDLGWESVPGRRRAALIDASTVVVVAGHRLGRARRVQRRAWSINPDGRRALDELAAVS